MKKFAVRGFIEIDVGVLVYFASIIQREFPELSVERYQVTLYELELECEVKGYVEYIEYRFVMILKKGKINDEYK